MESYSIENLSFSYPEQSRLALNNLNLKINRGEFIVLCGASGCGKTTLLRQLKPILAPHGNKKGNILFEGTEITDIDQRTQASNIGFVLQNPDNQIVTDKVWHELAFGLESLGEDTNSIRLKVAEMASFFGIQNWFYKKVTELSGGQKQLLNLASIMAMQPSVLILDEPTSQLDPIAASDFLQTLSKINRELGTTIILTEHRLEEAMPLSDRVIVMEDGKIISDGDPKEVGKQLAETDNKMFLAMPVPMKVYMSVDNNLECPITVREGRKWLDKYSEKNKLKKLEKIESDYNKKVNPTVEIKDAWFKYEKNLSDVVKGVNMKAYNGEIYAILGGNGTGKSTTLSLISGINNPYRGQVLIEGEDLNYIEYSRRYNGLLGVLSQNPQTLFVKKTVSEDLNEVVKNMKISLEEKELKIKKVIKLCNLENLLNQHPYDLSGGEQQRAALAKVLLLEPKILLLDEPTKGLDAEFKEHFAGILEILKKQDVTIIMVSHDIEFCAKYADRCALFFDGMIVTEKKPEEFFKGNSFYTTSANRMARHKLDDIVTSDDLIYACGGVVKKAKKLKIDDDIFKKQIKYDNKQKSIKKKRDIKDKILAVLSIVIILLSSFKLYPILSDIAWSNLIDNGIKIENQWEYTILLILLLTSLMIFINKVFKKDKKIKISVIQTPIDERKLSKRTKISVILILLLIPFTIFFGVFYLQNKKYYFISLLIMLQVMIPFLMIFEDRKPEARELVILSVICAIAVAGRGAFFMIPQFKPVAAITIIAGVAFGAESGFLVGAVSMLLSNMIYGQGPHTPWQMFAMGIIGFLAGILFKKGFLRRNKNSLAIFGGFSVFIIYGLIMNLASVVIWQDKITLPMVLTYIITGIPFDLIHAAATIFFIFIMGEEMLEKLDRIKTKYGLVE